MRAFARNTDPDTSHEAARSVESKLNNLERLVYESIVDMGGATTKEIAAHTGKDRVTVSPRIKPLCNKHLVEDSGARRGKSIVWVRVKGQLELPW